MQRRDHALRHGDRCARRTDGARRRCRPCARTIRSQRPRSAARISREAWPASCPTIPRAPASVGLRRAGSRSPERSPCCAVKHSSQGDLAARSRATEVEELHVAGGYQDHYAAAYGGALLLSLHRLRRRGASRASRSDRRRNSCGAACCSTRASRGSRARPSPRCAMRTSPATRARRSALARMKTLAIEMADALRAGDLDALGRARRRALGASARAASAHHDAEDRARSSRRRCAAARSA